MENYIQMKDGVELLYKKDMIDDPKAIILINHGFAEHLLRYDYTAQRFLEAGYGVYRYDLRAHGRSKSKLGHIDSFNDFVGDSNEMVDLIIRENKDIPIFMLGHSMGGLITALYGAKYRDKLKGQLFSGAMLDYSPSVKGIRKPIFNFTNIFFKKLYIKNPVDDFICSDKDVYDDYMKDTLVLKKASLNFYVEFLINGVNTLNKDIKDYNYPFFMIHGEMDKIVPKEFSLSFYEKAPSKDKEIKIYEGLYHEILNEKIKDQIIEDMVNWLDKRID